MSTIAEITERRREFLKIIKGKYMSQEFIDSSNEKKSFIIFSIDDSFTLGNFPIIVKGLKTNLIDRIETDINIRFYWINKFLISTFIDFQGGVLAKNIENEEIGFYHSLYFANFEFTPENLILKFKKV